MLTFFKDKTSEGFQSGAATVIKEKLVYDSATTEFRKRKKEGFTPAVTIGCSDGFIPKAATVATWGNSVASECKNNGKWFTPRGSYNRVQKWWFYPGTSNSYQGETLLTECR